jgi:MATE family multidrug resistance protein
MKALSISKYRKDYRDILRLGLPILVGQLGMIVTGFADNIMVGRYSTEALASASFVNNFFNWTLFCIMGFTYGLTPLISSLYARKEDKSIGEVVRNGLRVNIAFTCVVMAIMTLLYFFIDKMGQPEELLPTIRPYYLIYLVGMLPVSIFNVFAQWSYGVNNSRMPMWIILISNGINIVGNWILIFGYCGMPEMGLMGAGISTLVARVFCPVAIMWVFFGKRSNVVYHQGYRMAQMTRKAASKIWRISIPIALQMTFEAASFSAGAVMAGWLGAISLAAYQIIIITGTLGFCIYYSIGAAVTVIVANSAGLDDKPAMRRKAWAGYHIVLAIMCCSSLIFLILGRPIMSMFTTDQAVLTLAVSLIIPLVVYQISDATQIVFAGALRGTSNVMPMLWIAFVSYVIVGLPVTYLLGFVVGLGAHGIILSFFVSLGLAGTLFIYHFLKTTRYSL